MALKHLLIFIGCIFTASLQARVFEPIVFTPETESVLLTEKIQYLDNREGIFHADQVLEGRADEKFQTSKDIYLLLIPPKAPTTGDYWLQFIMENQRSEDVVLILDYAATPNVSRIFFFKPDSLKAARTIVLDGKLIRTKRHIPIPPGSWKIFLEISPDDFSFPAIKLEIKTVKSLTSYAPQMHFLSISYGICLALIFYNFILALTLRHRAHFIYIAYSIALLLYYEGRYQILAEHFGMPELPKWSLVAINASSSFLFLAFIYEILGVAKNIPFWKIPFQFLIALWPCLVIYSFFDRTVAQMILLALLLFFAPFGTVVGIHAVIKKVPAARLLLLSALLPGFGSFIHFLPNVFSAWFSVGFIEIVQLLALDLEMILLSMAIGFKINREQEWMRKNIDHAYAELKTIVYPHQVQQIWDGRSLSQTMPLGMQNAYIIVFDVIASSKMKIKDPRRFLSGIFRECSELMMKNYNPDELKSDAYRIKEMGDGFICSVGFPFGTSAANNADHSVKLAHEFIRIFDKHVAASQANEMIHCAIGIAFGPVEAFYPRSGAQVYDLFGRGIILAHRYEGMRDILFRWLKQRDSIIILHKPVFSKLSRELQQEFVEVDLTTSDFKVRDDEDATQLYYQLTTGREQRKMLRGDRSA